MPCLHLKGHKIYSLLIFLCLLCLIKTAISSSHLLSGLSHQRKPTPLSPSPAQTCSGKKQGVSPRKEVCEGLGRGFVKDHSPKVGAMASCGFWLLPALQPCPARAPCSRGALGASGPHCFPAWRGHDSCKRNRRGLSEVLHVVSQAPSVSPTS